MPWYKLRAAMPPDEALSAAETLAAMDLPLTADEKRARLAALLGIVPDDDPAD